MNKARITKPFENLLLAGLFGTTFLYFLGFLPTAAFFGQSLDHGYQLALGTTLLSGAVPGCDFFSHYGPLVGYFSALGLLAGGVAGECAVCAIGYAAVLTLAFRIASKSGGNIAGALAFACLLFLPARFYKWYYWLIPVLALFMAEFVTSVPPTAKRMAVRYCLCGAGLATALLFRLDLGLQWLTVTVVAFMVDTYRRRPPLRDQAVNSAAYALGAVCTLTVVNTWWALSGGNPFAVIDYYRASLDASAELLRLYSRTPKMAFDYSLTVQNVFPLVLLLVPIICITNGLWAIRELRRDRSSGVAVHCLLFSVASLSIFPQALHRSDIAHFLQALPPLAILATLLMRGAFTGAWLKVARVQGLTLLLAFAFFAVKTDSDQDYRARPFQNFRAILRLPDSASDLEDVRLAEILRRHTTPEQRVFFAMNWTPSPAIFLSGRAPAGVVPVYAPGLFASASIVARNSAALQAAPPAALVVQRNDWPLKTPTTVPPYAPRLSAAWSHSFTRLVGQTKNYIVLMKPTDLRDRNVQ